ncbi:MAG: phosphoglycerate mutase family protein [bacterium]
MRIHAISLRVILSLPLTIATVAPAQPTIYIVRHAEKVPEWLGDGLDQYHPLSEAGMVRAQELAEQFEKGTLVAIYSSPTTRTLHTVQPLAHKLWLQVQITAACWDTSAMSAFFADLKIRHKPEEAVLLVSHSNHISHLLIKAGLPRSCWLDMGIIAPDESGELMIEGYDNLWRVERLGETRKGCEGFARKRF